jgi:hypothetical protein
VACVRGLLGRKYEVFTSARNLPLNIFRRGGAARKQRRVWFVRNLFDFAFGSALHKCSPALRLRHAFDVLFTPGATLLSGWPKMKIFFVHGIGHAHQTHPILLGLKMV